MRRWRMDVQAQPIAQRLISERRSIWEQVETAAHRADRLFREDSFRHTRLQQHPTIEFGMMGDENVSAEQRRYPPHQLFHGGRTGRILIAQVMDCACRRLISSSGEPKRLHACSGHDCDLNDLGLFP